MLGADPTHEAPLLDLALRRGSFHATLPLSRARGVPDWNDYAARDVIGDARGPLYVLAPARPKLAEIATETTLATPPEITALAWEIARALEDRRFDEARPAGRIAQALMKATHPLVVCETTWGADLLHATAEIARLLSEGREHPCLISLLGPECNSFGLAMLGGRPTEAAFAAVAAGEADGAVVLENDLYRRAAPRRVTEFLGGLRFLVVLDSLFTQTAAVADLALPVPATAELTGTYVSLEARAQRFFQVFQPEGEPRPAWQVLRGLTEMTRPGAALWEDVEDVQRALAEEYPGTLRRRGGRPLRLLARRARPAHRPPAPSRQRPCRGVCEANGSRTHPARG